MFNFFRLASRARVTWADKGPLTDNRGPPGATSGPLFPSHMTLQYSNWVGPILSSGFRVAAKLTFSDWPQAPRGPKKGQKGPFRAPYGKKRNVRLRSHRNFGRFGTNLSPVALFVSELRSFFQWPPVVFYRFPICVSARGPPKRARIAFLLIDHLNHIEKESTWCARITRRIAPSG